MKKWWKPKHDKGAIHALTLQHAPAYISVEALRKCLLSIPFHDLSNGKGACVVCFKQDLENAINNLNHFRVPTEMVEEQVEEQNGKL